MSKPKPKTKREWCLIRARLSCKMGCDALENKGMPDGAFTKESVIEFALFKLLDAVQEIAAAMEGK